MILLFKNWQIIKSMTVSYFSKSNTDLVQKLVDDFKSDLEPIIEKIEKNDRITKTSSVNTSIEKQVNRASQVYKMFLKNGEVPVEFSVYRNQKLKDYLFYQRGDAVTPGRDYDKGIKKIPAKKNFQFELVEKINQYKKPEYDIPSDVNQKDITGSRYVNASPYPRLLYLALHSGRRQNELGSIYSKNNKLYFKLSKQKVEVDDSFVSDITTSNFMRLYKNADIAFNRPIKTIGSGMNDLLKKICNEIDNNEPCVNVHGLRAYYNYLMGLTEDKSSNIIESRKRLSHVGDNNLAHYAISDTSIVDGICGVCNNRQRFKTDAQKEKHLLSNNHKRNLKKVYKQ